MPPPMFTPANTARPKVGFVPKLPDSAAPGKPSRPKPNKTLVIRLFIILALLILPIGLILVSQNSADQEQASAITPPAKPQDDGFIRAEAEGETLVGQVAPMSDEGKASHTEANPPPVLTAKDRNRLLKIIGSD